MLARNLQWDWTSLPTLRDWREQSRSFESIAYYLRPEGSTADLRSAEGVETVQGSKVSADFFDVLGVAPLLGRAFSAEEAQRGERLVVVSQGFWQSRLGGSRSVLNQRLEIDGQNFAIAGIMPPAFQFPARHGPGAGRSSMSADVLR